MAVDTKHPLYTIRLPQWTQMSDCYKGEQQIKSKTTDYLPATEGMVIDGMDAGKPGKAAYDAYIARAVFHDFVKQAVESMVGIMHREEARIEVPDALKPIVERMTIKGESAQMLLRRLNEWQLLYGRAGLLVEVPNGQTVDKARPFVALYAAPSIINWDDGIRAEGQQRLEFVTFDESDFERVGQFEWEYHNRYRVCAMSDAEGTLDANDQSAAAAGGVYRVAALGQDKTDISPTDWVTPSLGGRTMDRIPFVFVNTKDMVSDPDDPPLMGLSNLTLAVYRGEADYRQNLHLQGQDTLVIIGADTEKSSRVGAGAQINLPRESDAKYVGVGPDGLQQQKEAIENDKNAAGEMTTKLFDSTGTTYQSGEALRIRVSAKTATLTSIARTSGEALREVLVLMAQWMGLSESEQKKIVVEPNTDFAETMTASRTALELSQSKSMGFPISQKSLHRFAVRNDLTELTYEQEIEAIKAEEPLVPQTAQGIGGQAGGVLGRATGGSRVPRGAESNTPPSRERSAPANQQQ